MRDAIFEKKETTNQIMQEFKEDKKEVNECKREDKAKCDKEKHQKCNDGDRCDEEERHECDCHCGRGGSKLTPTATPTATPTPTPTVEAGPTPTPTIQGGVGGANPDNFPTPLALPRAGSDMLFLFYQPCLLAQLQCTTG